MGDAGTVEACAAKTLGWTGALIEMPSAIIASSRTAPLLIARARRWLVVAFLFSIVEFSVARTGFDWSQTAIRNQQR
jgi:hypothetical protein